MNVAIRDWRVSLDNLAEMDSPDCPGYPEMMVDPVWMASMDYRGEMDIQDSKVHTTSYSAECFVYQRSIVFFVLNVHVLD